MFHVHVRKRRSTKDCLHDARQYTSPSERLTAPRGNWGNGEVPLVSYGSHTLNH
jgi:hypothetical protein